MLARMCLLALGVSAAMLLPSTAQAGEQTAETSVRSSWRLAPPTLSLQPEGARLFLNVPPEWLPRLEPSRFGAFMLDKRVVLHPGANAPTFVCGVGLRLRLEIEDPARALGFGVTVLPRAAVAELRFDPIPPWLR